NILDQLVCTRVDNIQLTWGGLDSGVFGPVVVRPPGITTSNSLGIDKSPASASVTWSFKFRNDTNTTSATIFDNLLNILLSVNFTLAVGITKELRIFLNFNGPRLSINNVPVENVE